MTLLRTPSYESSLSQAERLALCAGRFSPSVLGCDSEPLVRTVAPARFPSPRIKAVSENEWLNEHYEGDVTPSLVEIEDDDDTSDESELKAFALHKRCDYMREHSLLMPSQRGYAAAWKEARDYGYASE